MMTAKKGLAGLALGLTVAALATPSFAQMREDRGSAARSKAIHDCSVQSVKQHPNYTDETGQITSYYVGMGQRATRVS
jgi:hypothetical protein